MPVDAGIALASRPPQLEPVGNQYAQVQGLRGQQQQQQQQQQLTANELALQQGQQQLQQQTLAENQLKVAATQRQQADLVTLNGAIAANTDPATGKTNHQGVAATLSQQNAGHLVNDYLAHADQNEEIFQKIRTADDAYRQTHLDIAANVADRLLALPAASRPQALQTFLVQGSATGVNGKPSLDPDTVKQLQPLAQADPATLEQHLQSIAALGSPAYQEKKAALAKTTAETKLLEAGGPRETKSVLLDGQPAEVSVNKQGRFFDASNTDVTNRVKPLPTAQTPLAVPMATPLDLTPPKGPAANRPDPLTGRTPAAIHQDAIANALKGTIPDAGRGTAPVAMAIRNAVANRAAALVEAAGTDKATLQAEYAANKATLTKLEPQYRATAVAAGTATDNLDLAISQSAQVARTGAKLVNRYTQWAQGNLTPAAGLSKFETYVYTAAREYAKVTSGSAASAQGLTDSATREAEKLLNTAQSPAAFEAVTEAMKNDMANVTKNQTAGVAKVAPAVANFLAVAHGLPPAAAAATAAPAAGPKVGDIGTVKGQRVRITAVHPDGSLDTEPVK